MCLTDLGGYVFGKILKGPKLTKYSPNKTYSGLLGSFFLSLLLIPHKFFFESNRKLFIYGYGTNFFYSNSFWS